MYICEITQVTFEHFDTVSDDMDDIHACEF